MRTVQNNVKTILGGNDLPKLESASLRLNKFTDTDSNGGTKTRELKEVCRLAEKQKFAPKPLSGDDQFQMKLGGRLLINHSGGVLENAGLCLHKFFNYPMIPGSALKGVTRHYARQINANDDVLQRIFGDDTKDGDNSGTIVFLAAVPADKNWELVLDILTPHKDDFHNPIPIPFIAVEKGAIFQFALKKTSRGTEEDLKIAVQWLKEALVENGIGGKTTSGYGRFSGKYKGETIQLQLVTPGFFGGAEQYEKDETTLRISSMRGMLRYWWRIAMAEFLPLELSKKMENLLWGHTERAGLVRLSITSNNESVQLFNYKDRFNVESNFANQHGIDPRNSGLHYLAYGMDERVRNKTTEQQEDKKRFYVEAGSQWSLNISVRESGLIKGLAVDDVKKQVLLALALLCRFGGLGSKSRKGFGSLHWNDAWTLEKCREIAKHFTEKLKGQIAFTSPAYSFGNVIQRTINIPTADAWLAIDKLGLAVKQFASSQKHRPEKAALGLPKQIHGPRKEPMQHQTAATHRPPLSLKRQFERFASPIWYHFEPSGNGLQLHVLAFPSAAVIDVNTSNNMLSGLVNHLQVTLTPAFFTPPSTVAYSTSSSRPQSGQSVINQVGNVKAGSRISGRLLDEKTKKGGWKVETFELGIGCIQNSDDVPADKNPGDTINLEVKIAIKGQAQFKYLS
jgi:CRISPR-associated protein Cmr6